MTPTAATPDEVRAALDKARALEVEVRALLALCQRELDAMRSAWR